MGNLAVALALADAAMTGASMPIAATVCSPPSLVNALAGMRPFDRLVGTDDIFVEDRPAINANALIESHEVRGGVKPDPVTGGLEDGGQGGGHRTFAVGAGHVDGSEILLGISQAA